MGKTTGIAWTNATWNPWQGCTKVSDGCKNCYMYREKKRYGQDPFTVVRSKPATFNAPLKWNLPEGSRIFVCSWSDFFHEDADDWRGEAWKIMRQLPQYDFLIPTKRPERIMNALPLDWKYDNKPFKNVWLGVSIEDRKTAMVRILELIKIPAHIRWLSCEPLLEATYLALDGTVPKGSGRIYEHIGDKIHWVVVGGESGLNCRAMEIDWARDIVAQCRENGNGIAVFVKQLGGYPNSRHELDDLPEDLRIREFPVFRVIDD